MTTSLQLVRVWKRRLDKGTIAIPYLAYGRGGCVRPDCDEPGSPSEQSGKLWTGICLLPPELACFQFSWLFGKCVFYEKGPKQEKRIWEPFLSSRNAIWAS